MDIATREILATEGIAVAFIEVARRLPGGMVRGCSGNSQAHFSCLGRTDCFAIVELMAWRDFIFDLHVTTIHENTSRNRPL